LFEDKKSVEVQKFSDQETAGSMNFINEWQNQNQNRKKQKI